MSSFAIPPRRLFVAAAVAAFVIPLAVYIATLSPGLNFEDPVEFAVGAAALGLDHPSGYPLETLWAHLFGYFPAGELAWRFNLSSAAAAAGAALFTFLLVWDFIGARATTLTRMAGAALATTFTAFGLTLWSQAVVTEAYALNAALIAAALWLGWRARAEGGRWWYALAFTAGLAAANHTSSLLLTVPLLIYVGWRRRPQPAAIVLAAAFFTLALSVYMYAPVRAARDPALNWGSPATLGRFWTYVRRSDMNELWWPRYRYLGFHALELGRFLLTEYGPAAGLLAGLGGILAWRRTYGRMLAVIAFIGGPLAMFALVGLLRPVQIIEIQVWYIPFFLAAAALAGIGVGLLTEHIKSPGWRRGAAAAAVFIALVPMVYNLPPNNRHAFHFTEEHARNLLRTFPYGAVAAFRDNGRLGIYELVYFHDFFYRRPDVAILESSGTVGTREGVPAPGERNISPMAETVRWANLMTRHFRDARHPVFYSSPDAETLGWGVVPVPFGLLYHLESRAGNPLPYTPPWRHYEYKELRAVGRALENERPAVDPTAFRMWANYYTQHSHFAFARGDITGALADLAMASRLVGRDHRSAWFIASVYAEYGYFEQALPIFEVVKKEIERYRYDTRAGVAGYCNLLNALGEAYAETGAMDSARRQFEESLALDPDQPDLKAYMTSLGLTPPESGGPRQ